MVTGASRGIGLALAEGFAEVGADVVVTARSSESCAGAVELVRSHGQRALALSLRLEDLDDVARAVERSIREFGGVDVLVNNAGILRPHRIDRLSVEEFDELYAVNVRGPVFLSKSVVPHMAARGGGAIVNIGAVGAVRPMEGIGAYSSTKAAMLAWTKVMAREWASAGVRVNTLIPGPIATDMILPRDPQLRDQFVADMARETLIGRLGTPDDLVGAALFLAGDESSYMTGQTLIVDGGMLT